MPTKLVNPISPDNRSAETLPANSVLNKTQAETVAQLAVTPVQSQLSAHVINSSHLTADERAGMPAGVSGGDPLAKQSQVPAVGSISTPISMNLDNTIDLVVSDVLVNETPFDLSLTSTVGPGEQRDKILSIDLSILPVIPRIFLTLYAGEAVTGYVNGVQIFQHYWNEHVWTVIDEISPSDLVAGVNEIRLNGAEWGSSGVYTMDLTRIYLATDNEIDVTVGGRLIPSLKLRT